MQCRLSVFVVGEKLSIKVWFTPSECVGGGNDKVVVVQHITLTTQLITFPFSVPLLPFDLPFPYELF